MIRDMSIAGKFAFTVVVIYLVVALIVPALPLRDPMAYRAPPTDIFVPEAKGIYNFSFKIENMATYGLAMYIISSQNQFVVYDTSERREMHRAELPPDNYSDLQILRIYPNGYPVFYNSHNVYLYDQSKGEMLEVDAENTSALWVLNDPFNAFRGFVTYNRTGLHAYEYDPYAFFNPITHAWDFACNDRPLGIHYTYKILLISFSREIVALNSEGEVIWRIAGNFTSNPVYIPIYGSSAFYVASTNTILSYSTANGTLLGRISMPEQVVRLEYYGQNLYAYTSDGTFGKVDLLANGFSWKIDGVDSYVMNPFIDGMGIVQGERVEFILIADGTAQWGLRERISGMDIGEQYHVPYLFVLSENRSQIIQYSYSGKLITPLPPNNKYLLGTDFAGRDVLSQLLWSFRSEIYIAAVSGIAVLVLGTLWGLVAGYFSGLPDDLLLMLSDSMLFIPAIGYAALMIYILGISHHIEATILASIFALSPLEARAVRNYTKVIKEKPYVESAKGMGAGSIRVMFGYIFPEIYGISLVYALSATTMALLLEVGISFLGFGNYTIPTWGWMVTNAYFTGYWDRWWLVLPPLFLLWLIVYSLYLLSHEMYIREYVLRALPSKRPVNRESAEEDKNLGA